jgi:hypothetical protein
MIVVRPENARIIGMGEGLRKWHYCHRRKCEITLRKAAALNGMVFVTGLVEILNDKICRDIKDFDNVLEGLNLLGNYHLFENIYAQKLLERIRKGIRIGDLLFSAAYSKRFPRRLSAQFSNVINDCLCGQKVVANFSRTQEMSPYLRLHVFCAMDWKPVHYLVTYPKKIRHILAAFQGFYNTAVPGRRISWDATLSLVKLGYDRFRLLCDGLTATVLLAIKKGRSISAVASVTGIELAALESLVKDLSSKKCGCLVVANGSEINLNKTPTFSEEVTVLPQVAERTVLAFWGREETSMLLSEDVQMDAAILRALKKESGMRVESLVSIVGNGLKFMPDRERFIRRLNRLIEMQFVEKDMWGTYRYLP